MNKILSNPGVVIALITTLLGSVSVSIISGKISTRELKQEAISGLMGFTKQAELNDPNAILKLTAYVSLIEENEDMDLNVSGFKAIVNQVKSDNQRKLEVTRDSLVNVVTDKNATLNAQKNELASLNEELVGNKSASATFRRNLQKKINEKENQIKNSLRERDDLVSNLTVLNNKHEQQKKTLRVAQVELDKAYKNITALSTDKERIAIQMEAAKIDTQKGKALIDSLSNDIEKLKAERERLKHRVSSFSTLLAEKNKIIIQLQTAKTDSILMSIGIVDSLSRK
jgi:chromosome segregation ATPase